MFSDLLICYNENMSNIEMGIESRNLKIKKNEEREKNEEIVDWFSTLPEVESVKKRLYNPRHRTAEAKETWDKLRKVLERNKSSFSFCMGSKDVVVHLHGSMLLGVGTEGKKSKDSHYLWETPPSDIDLYVFVGKKGDNEKKYQAKYAAEDKDFSGSLKESERLSRFFEQSNFETEFNRRGDGLIVNVPELMNKIEEICFNLENKQEIAEEDKWQIYNAAMLFGSDALFQGKKGLEGKWRNQILKILLKSPAGGEILWNEGIRKYFNMYLAGYEDNPVRPTQEAKEAHKKRVGIAFDKILAQYSDNAQKLYKEPAKKALSKMRRDLQLPKYEDLKKLKEKLYAK